MNETFETTLYNAVMQFFAFIMNPNSDIIIKIGLFFMIFTIAVFCWLTIDGQRTGCDISPCFVITQLNFAYVGGVLIVIIGQALRRDNLLSLFKTGIISAVVLILAEVLLYALIHAVIPPKEKEN